MRRGAEGAANREGGRASDGRERGCGESGSRQGREGLEGGRERGEGKEGREGGTEERRPCGREGW